MSLGGTPNEEDVLRGCATERLRLADESLAVAVSSEVTTAWERPDIYAGATLATACELVESVLAETAARRVQNAVRLARSLYETELEMAWILADPTVRLRMRYAEDARSALERLPAEARDLIRALGHEDQIDPHQRLLAEERLRLNRGPESGVMPGFGPMATDLGREEDHKLGYALLSWASHPGLSSAGRHVLAKGDRVGFARHPDPIEPFLITGPIAQAVRSLGSIIHLADGELGRETSSAVSAAEALAEAIHAHINEALARQLRASERQ